jgi:hypothetical protein
MYAWPLAAITSTCHGTVIARKMSAPLTKMQLSQHLAKLPHVQQKCQHNQAGQNHPDGPFSQDR